VGCGLGRAWWRRGGVEVFEEMVLVVNGEW
jgi:hypothetical protein